MQLKKRSSLCRHHSRKLCSQHMTHPLQGTLLQAIVMGSWRLPTKVIWSHGKVLTPKWENTTEETNSHSPWGNSNARESNQEADKLALPHHSWCTPWGVHPLVPRKSWHLHNHQGFLVAPYVQHEEKGRLSDEMEGTESSWTKCGSAFLKRRWQDVPRSINLSLSDNLAPKFRRISHLVQVFRLLIFPKTESAAGMSQACHLL